MESKNIGMKNFYNLNKSIIILWTNFSDIFGFIKIYWQFSIAFFMHYWLVYGKSRRNPTINNKKIKNYKKSRFERI